MTNSYLVLKIRKNKVMWIENGKLLLKVAYADNSTAQMVKRNHNGFCFTEKGEAEFGYSFNNLFKYNRLYEYLNKNNLGIGRSGEKNGRSYGYRNIDAQIVYQYKDTDTQRYLKEMDLEREAAQKKWYVHYDGILSFGKFAYGVDSVYDDDAIFDTEEEVVEYIKNNYPEWAEQYEI